MLTERILNFAELGRLAFRLTSDFAETITDPDILDDVRGVLETDAGAIDRLYDVTLDGETFSGKAEQKVSLAKSRVFEFRVSPSRIYFKPLNAAEMAEYADTDQGWTDIVEYAAKSSRSGKKLNCKAGNYQCGGACINESRGCTKTPNTKQQATIKQAAAKAKAKSPTTSVQKTKTLKAPKQAKAKPTQDLDALKAAYDQTANDEFVSRYEKMVPPWESGDIQNLMHVYADEVKADGGKQKQEIVDAYKQGSTNRTPAIVRQTAPDEYEAIGQSSKDLMTSAVAANQDTRVWRVSVPNIPEQVAVAEALQKFPDLDDSYKMTKPADSGAFKDIGNLMIKYADETTSAATGKMHNATDADIEAAAKLLLENNARQWVPVVMREIIEEDGRERYEVIGNHFVHDVATKAGLSKIWGIVTESEDRRKKFA